MRLLLDMGLSPALVPILQALGHEATHLLADGLNRLPDPEILAKAKREQRVILTHDLDFADLVAASGEALPSVVIFRLRNMRPESVLLHLQKILSQCRKALEQGAVVSVSEQVIRSRRLPIASNE